jgi:Hypothetical methyltransferase
MRKRKIQMLESLFMLLETPTKRRKTKQKRKRDETEVRSSDQETPENKVKVQQSDQNEAKEPLTYGKGKSQGIQVPIPQRANVHAKDEESLKILQDYPTSFVAYHDGYRHQIALWPMNPLSRIIKNIKKL